MVTKLWPLRRRVHHPRPPVSRDAARGSTTRALLRLSVAADRRRPALWIGYSVRCRRTRERARSFASVARRSIAAVFDADERRDRSWACRRHALVCESERAIGTGFL